MSELLFERPELQPHEAIARVFHYWLTTEIKTASQSQNAILDDWESFRENLALPFSDQRNVGARKASSHYGRLELWTKEFAQDPTSELTLAHQLYGTLTGMSGAYRHTGYAFALSEEDYLSRRAQTPLSIDIFSAVGNRLTERYGRLPNNDDLARKIITAEELVETTQDVNESRLKAIETLHDDHCSLRGLKKLSVLMKLVNQQRDWLHLGVDYVLFAAQENGDDLTKVPFMEPLPITKAKIEYPFAKLL